MTEDRESRAGRVAEAVIIAALSAIATKLVDYLSERAKRRKTRKKRP